MTAALISPELKSAMKRLRLGRMLPTLGDRITLAKKDDLPIEEFLLMVFTDEVERRKSTAASRRATEAGLDPDMVFERWDKSAKVSLDRRVLNELASLRFVRAHRNVVVLGPVGVGKTFISNALGHVACKPGEWHGRVRRLYLPPRRRRPRPVFGQHELRAGASSCTRSRRTR